MQSSYTVIRIDLKYLAGLNLELLCLLQWDSAHKGNCITSQDINENYAKLYFDAKHLEKGLNRGWRSFWCLFFQKSTFFGQFQTLP